MPYTPTPEFIAALEQIDALTSDQNTPEPVIALGHATKAGLMELAAKQQMLQTAFEAQQQQPQMQAAQLKTAQTKQDALATADTQPASNELIEAAPPPLSVPPGQYEAPRGEAAHSGGSQTHVVSGYEPFRGEPSEQQ